jgi:hypothetical protein
MRGGGTRMIPGIVQKINMIECQLHCFLLEQQVYAVDPRMVSAYYSFRTGSKKKRDAIRLVNEFLSSPNPPVLVGDTLCKYYQEQDKQDDLADSLLQAVAYYQWRRNAAMQWSSVIKDLL